jgi:RimJ/RimL family protein N-acetyltransferase
VSNEPAGPAVPTVVATTRLSLRPWSVEDAVALHPILVDNWAHLGPWIPARVATPVPIPELEIRLAGFATDFASDREWRYAMFTAGESELLGEFGLYPRSSAGRVAYGEADRVELGYWLRSDATGRGYVTEAGVALLEIASSLKRFHRAEIRCHPRNLASAAVPRRLGFVVESTVDDVQVWSRVIARSSES